MIIKIIPENEEEKKRIRESEHVGVTDFFICGERKDSDGDAIDFHEWSGKYPKLIGPLFYYAYLLINEQNIKNMSAKATESFVPHAASNPPFIKRGSPKNQEVSPVDMNSIKSDNAVLKFNPQPMQENVIDVQPSTQISQDTELPVEEPLADEESKGAEDN